MNRDFDSDMRKPKRRLNNFFLVVLVVICFAFLATVTWWSAVSYSLFRVAQDPAIVGRVAEEVTNSFTETVKDKAKEKVKEKVDNFKEKLLK